MSSEAKTRKLRRTGRDFAFLSTIHAASSALTAASLWLLLWFFLYYIVGAYSSPVQVPMVLPFVFALAAVIGEAAFTLHFYRQRISSAARLRLVLVMGLIGYAAASLFHQGPLLQRFIPSFGNIGFTGFTLGVFASMGAFHHQLLHREEITSLFEGVKGTDLLQLLQREHPQILDAFQSIKNHNRSSFMAIVFAALINLVLWFAQLYPQQRPVLLVLTVLTVLGGVLGLALGNSYLDDHRSLQRTLLLSLNQRVGRIVIALAMIGPCLFLGFVITTGNSILPPEVLLQILTWLSGLFDTGSDGEAFLRVQELMNPPVSTLQPPIPPAIAAEPLISPETWALILEILRNALIIGGTAALLFFIFYPMFKKGAWNRLGKGLRKLFSTRFWQRLFLGLRRAARRIQRVLQGLFRSRRINLLNEGMSEEEYIEQYLRELRKDENSPEARRLPGKLVQLFQRYVSQATRLGVVLSSNLTLRDLSRAAAQKQPEAEPAGFAVCGLLERILYDLKQQGEAERKLLDELEQAVRVWEAVVPAETEASADSSEGGAN